MNEKTRVSMLFGLACMNGLYTVLLVMLFWNWFVVPLGVVKISFFWAMGLYLLVNTLLDGVNHFDFAHKDEPLKDFKGYRGLIKRTMILIMGFLCSLAI